MELPHNPRAIKCLRNYYPTLTIMLRYLRIFGRKGEVFTCNTKCGTIVIKLK